jgi:predicted MFS family arabinose efflux permease
MGVGRFAFTPLLPMMQDDQGVTVAAGGWLASANYLGYLAGALGAVWLRMAPQTVIRWGLALIAAATLGMAATDSFIAWSLLRFVAGVLSALVLVSASAWSLAKLAALKRPALAGVVFAGVGTRIALAGLVCLGLMQAAIDSQRAWVVLGGLAVGLTAAIWPLFGRADAVVPGARMHSGALNSRGAWRLILCYGASGFGYIIPATFLPVMAKEIIPDPLVFGWSWPLFGLASAAATLAAGALLRRLGSRRVWLWSHALMAVGVAIPVFWHSFGGVVLSAVLVGGTFMVSVLGAFAQAREFAADRATPLIAAMTACYALGQLAGPVMVSLLADGAGVSVSLLAAAAVLAASVWGISQAPPASALPR